MTKIIDVPNFGKVEFPAEMSDDDIVAAIKKTSMSYKSEPKRSMSFGEQLNDIPRQVGLTARYGIEGVGDTLNFLASPIRGAINLAGGDVAPANFSSVASSLGLPKPRSGLESAIGEGAKLMAGASVPLGLSKQIANLGGTTTRAVGSSMAANPLQQIASAGSAGLAGGYARETGGNDASQFLASLAGGIAAPMALSSGAKLMGAAQGMRSTVSPQTVDVKIDNAFKGTNINFGKLPQEIQASIRNDVKQALSIGGDVSPDNLRRLADYRLVGATPTRAGLTLDPAIVTQQKNLAKVGVNSKDLAAQELAQVANQNNARLIERINALGASRGVENEVAGGILSRSLSDVAASNKARIGDLYGAARDSSGRSAALDPSHFTQKLGDDLNQSNLEAFLPGEIRTMVNNFATGKTPLNVNTAEQFKTIVGNAQRASGDGNVRAALGLVRQSLDDTPLLGQIPRQSGQGGNQLALQGQFDQPGQSAIDAFNKARAANREFMGQVERTPSMAAAMDDASVKGFFDKFVLRGDSKSLRNTLNAIGGNQEAVQSIRDNVLNHLKQKATSGAADEVGAFSQSRFNSALKGLGDNKLKMLFSPEEIAQLKAVGRVASYEQFQPVGSAVNNSNTAAAFGGMLERIGNSPLLSKIPMGRLLAEPIQNISIGINSRNALNAPNALAVPRFMQEDQQRLLMSPAIFGLLGQPRE